MIDIIEAFDVSHDYCESISQRKEVMSEMVDNFERKRLNLIDIAVHWSKVSSYPVIFACAASNSASLFFNSWTSICCRNSSSLFTCLGYSVSWIWPNLRSSAVNGSCAWSSLHGTFPPELRSLTLPLKFYTMIVSQCILWDSQKSILPWYLDHKHHHKIDILVQNLLVLLWTWRSQWSKLWRSVVVSRRLFDHVHEAMIELPQTLDFPVEAPHNSNSSRTSRATLSQNIWGSSYL